MVAIREFIKPPVFDNESVNRQAQQLNAILLSISSLVFVYLLIRIASGDRIFGITNLVLEILILVMIGLQYFLRRGYVQAASYTLLSTGWIALAYLAWNADGIRDVAFIANIIIILMSSLLLGWRAASVFTTLTIAIGWFFAYAENAGMLVPDVDTAQALARDFTSIYVITTVLIYLVINSLQQALNRARQGEKDLSQLNNELERRVEERTQELSQAQTRTQALLSELAEALNIARMANYELIIPSQMLVLSDHFFELLGTTADSEGGNQLPLRQAVERFIHPDDRARMVTDIATIGTADMEGDLEYRMVHANAHICHFAFRFVVETNDTGAVIRVKGAVQDITERKQAEEQLREVENLYRRAIASADAVPYSRYYGDETFIFMGERIYDITGYTPEEMTPALFDSLVEETIMPAEDMDHVLAVQQSRAGQAPQWKADYRLRRRDGDFRWVADTSIELISAEGQSTGSVGILLDITERKQTEATLAKRALQLETVTQLATIIASIPDPETMLQTVVELTKERFDLYHTHIYVLNELGDTLELTAGAGEAGRTMVAQKHSIPLNREQSLVARAARTHEGVVVNDVTQAPDFLPNVLLPDTRAELAAPIIVEEDLLGVLDIQSNRVDAFSEEDVRVQTILAAQIAVALQNARTRKDTERILADLDTYSRRLAKEGWERYFEGKADENMGFVFTDGEIAANSAANGRTKMESDKGVVKPVLIRGEYVGQVMVADVDMDESETDMIMEAIAQGLGAHLEKFATE
jgi:PAS domain S-box-containing protein